MIGFPDKGDERALRRLWKEAFGDSDEFIELFFSRRYSPESTLVWKEGKRIVSMVFFPEYQYRSGGSSYRLGYICGAATKVSHRGGGLMGELLKASFGVMQERGYDYTALIPASDTLYGYYERFGYNSWFFRRRYHVNRGDESDDYAVKVTAAHDEKLLYEIYREGVSRLPRVVLQSSDTFSAVIAEFTLGGGEILMAGDSSFYLFVRREGNAIYLRESFSRNDDDCLQERAVASLLNHYRQTKSIIAETAIINSFRGEGEIVPTGMLKPLNEAAQQTAVNDGTAYMKFMLEE